MSSEPVEQTPPSADRARLEKGHDKSALSKAENAPVLCLSGGGFRATLFHLGAVRRLNELGLLAQLSVITSVSGGSILNGVLATRWARLQPGPGGSFTNFDLEIAEPVRAFCRSDLRTPLLLGTRLNAANWGALFRDYFAVSANFLAQAYEPFYKENLGNLPAPGPGVPRFVFCATNVRTGACWHFHGGPAGRMGDFYTGYCAADHVPVSEAVAASSAFPPGFSALRLRLPKTISFSRLDPWGVERPVSAKRGDLPPPTTAVPPLLTDGGVYDNLGVEPVWQRHHNLLVSDAGRPFATVKEASQLFTTRLGRVIDISMEQVGAVRKRWLVDDLLQKKRLGAIWAIHTRPEDIPVTDALSYPAPIAQMIHRIRTDLNAFSKGECAALENHGYALADGVLRSYAQSLCPNPGVPARWPNDNWLEPGKVQKALRWSHQRNILQDLWDLTFGARASEKSNPTT